LNLDLNLYYNSDVWTLNSANSSVTFNADRDWPSYGFRLDFGLIIKTAQNANLIAADGSKYTLTDSGGVNFNSTDSSYINLNLAGAGPSWPLTYKNGTQISYEFFPSTMTGQTPSFLRPIRINDTNGNFIAITYVAGTDQKINTITDTVGRIIQFNYDGNGNLSSITSNNGARIWATFAWNTTYALNYNFSAVVSDSPANGATLSVLTGVTLPNNTQYTFTYGAWGVVTQITNLSSSSQTRSYQSYNYPGTSAALSAPPTYTQQTVSDGGNTRTWTYSGTISNNLVSQSIIADPGGTSTITNLYTAGDWKDGLVSSAQVKDSAGHLLREVDNTWISDSTGNTNPRLSSVLTNLSDTAQQSRVDFVSYDGNGCVTDQKEYDFGLVLKREIATTYLTTYMSNHILELPTQVIIKDSNGTNVSRTDYSYDDNTLASTITGVVNHNDNYSGPRANLTRVTRYIDPVGGTGAITRSFSYDSLGNLVTAQLDNSTEKQWNFSSATQFAYPDSVVRGPSATQLTSSATYNLDTRTVATFTDENLKITQFTLQPDEPHQYRHAAGLCGTHLQL
jgi:YD repeat-containing protein